MILRADLYSRKSTWLAEKSDILHFLLPGSLFWEYEQKKSLENKGFKKGYDYE